MPVALGIMRHMLTSDTRTLHLGMASSSLVWLVYKVFVMLPLVLFVLMSLAHAQSLDACVEARYGVDEVDSNNQLDD